MTHRDREKLLRILREIQESSEVNSEDKASIRDIIEKLESKKSIGKEDLIRWMTYCSFAVDVIRFFGGS